MGGEAVWGLCGAATGGEHEVLVADLARGGLESSLDEVYAGNLGSEEIAATLAEGRDRGTDALGVDAPDGDLVDEGYERVRLLAIDEQRLARTPQKGGQVPHEGSPCEPAPDDNHARPAPDATRHRLTRPPEAARWGRLQALAHTLAASTLS